MSRTDLRPCFFCVLQTSAIGEKKIGLGAALKELGADMSAFGLRGIFRGQVRRALLTASLLFVRLLCVGSTACRQQSAVQCHRRVLGSRRQCCR